MNNLAHELDIQNASINDTAFSVKQLEQDEKNLITSWKRKELRRKKKNDENNYHIYKQKMNESRNSELTSVFYK